MQLYTRPDWSATWRRKNTGNFALLGQFLTRKRRRGQANVRHKKYFERGM